MSIILFSLLIIPFYFVNSITACTNDTNITEDIKTVLYHVNEYNQMLKNVNERSDILLERFDIILERFDIIKERLNIIQERFNMIINKMKKIKKE